MGKARADRLDGAGVFALGGRERDAARDEHSREIFHPGQGHHDRRETFVARRDADDSRPQGERADEAAKNLRGVIAKREAVEHAGRALGAPIARVRAITGEGQGAELPQLQGRGLDEQADFPVPGVVAQRDRFAVRRAQSALGADDEELFAADFTRIPPHPGVLAQAEDVAARPLAEHPGRERQASGRPGRFGFELIKLFAAGG